MGQDRLRFRQPPQGALERQGALGDSADLLPDLGPGVRLDEVPFPGQILLRGEGEAFFALAADLLGVPLPPAAPAVVAGRRCEVLTLAADRWLILVSGGEEEVLIRRFQQAFSNLLVDDGGRGCHSQAAAVFDQSDQRLVFHLYGPNAVDLLSRGSPSDVDSSWIKPNICDYIYVSGVPILVQTLEGDEKVGALVYRLLVECSKADYLVKWMSSTCEAY